MEELFNYLLVLKSFHKTEKKKIKSSWKEYFLWVCFKFWSMITFFETSKPSKSLIMVYKIFKNNCCPGLRAKFIQTQKWCYLTSLVKINILAWRLLVISSQTFSCKLNSSRAYSLWNMSYLLLTKTSDKRIYNR